MKNIILLMSLLLATTAIEAALTPQQRNVIRRLLAKVAPRPPIMIPRVGYGGYDPQQGDVGTHTGDKLHVLCYNRSQIDRLTYPIGAKIRQFAYDAIKRGYRLIDGAQRYGNDKAIGRAVMAAVRDGIIDRPEEVFVIGKLANTRMGPDALLSNVISMNHEFGRKAIDLLLIHHVWAVSYQERELINSLDYLETYKAMIAAYKKGLVRYIGVANLNLKQLLRIIEETGVVPHAIQMETHPYLPIWDLVQVCELFNITIVAYGPLGAPYKARQQYRPLVIYDPTINKLAKLYNVSPAQIILRWQIQRSPIISVIPHTENYRHMNENINVFDFSLAKHDMELINSLEKEDVFEGRIFRYEGFWTHKHFPFETPKDGDIVPLPPRPAHNPPRPGDCDEYAPY